MLTSLLSVELIVLCYLTYIDKCTCIKYVVSYIDYQHMSITSAIFIRVTLQEYKKYNKLPNFVSGTTQCHRLKHAGNQ
jgi:hypothetical protein